MKLLESFVKNVLTEDLDSFLQDTKDIYYSEYSDDESVKSGGKDVKRIWAKNVDRNFVQSLVKVHWIRLPDITRLQNLLRASGKDELSTAAYLPGDILRSGWSNYGVIVDGYVTLAANNMDAIYSGFSHGKEKDPRQAGSGMPKRAGVFKSGLARQYILDRKSFDPQQSGHNELLVDNWKVKGLLLPISPDGQMKATKADKQLFASMAKIVTDAGLPIYGPNMQTFTLEDVVNSAQS